jgi:alkylation response protein AidB-like acyl-CoA dehydrogenase
VTREGLLPADQVTVEPVIRGDASRPLGHVRSNGVEPEPLTGDFECAWHLSQSLLAADGLGVAEAMLELAVAYAKERHTFGRPIGSYQAVKQQIVEILRHAGTTRSLCFYAGYAAEAQPDELPLAAAAARFAAEEAADYATRTCIAVHGGIGATWEHDAHLYWRRAQLSRLLLGGVAGAGERVADEIIARARAREESVV